jgi:integrase
MVLDHSADPDNLHYLNPAKLTVQLRKKLGKVPAAKKPTNHPALPHKELPAFMAELRPRDGIAARALEFAILTAARTGEVLGARWQEIDTEARLWSVPAERMKGERIHRVPLSGPALAVLEAMRSLRQDDFVFPSATSNRSLSDMALLAVLKRLDRSDITTHGFRSTFRTWAADRTDYPREVVEMALAHKTADKTEGAYQRGEPDAGDMLDRRRPMMEAWARYCITPPGKVVPLRPTGSTRESAIRAD